MAKEHFNLTNAKALVYLNHDLTLSIHSWLRQMPFQKVVMALSPDDCLNLLLTDDFDVIVTCDKISGPKGENILDYLGNQIETIPTVYITDTPVTNASAITTLSSRITQDDFQKILGYLCHEEACDLDIAIEDIDDDVFHLYSGSNSTFDDGLGSDQNTGDQQTANTLPVAFTLCEQINATDLGYIQIKDEQISVPKPKSAIVANADAGEIARIRQYLTKVGITNIETVSNHETLWQRIKNNDCELAVLGCTFQSNEAFQLLNRLSHLQKNRNIPVLIVPEDDSHKEVIHQYSWCKPFERGSSFDMFKQDLLWICGKDLVSKKYEELAQASVAPKMRNTIGDAQKICNIIEENAENLPYFAEFALKLSETCANLGLPKLAEKSLEAAKSKAKSELPLIISELARCYQKNGKHYDAINTLKNEISADNLSIGNLCLLGEAELSIKKSLNALNSFKRALRLDPSDPVAKAGVRSSQNVLNHKSIMADSSRSAQNLAVSLNSLAITMASHKNYQMAIEQFRAALIFARNHEEREKIQFNLGRMYLTIDQADMAEKWFAKAAKLAQGEFKTKVDDYRKRAHAA